MSQHLASPEAERELVGAVFAASPEDLPRILEHVRPDDFSDQRLATIAKALLEMQSQGVPIDVVTLFRKMTDENTIAFVGGVKGISAAIDRAGTNAHVEHYAKIVSEKARLRRMLNLTRELGTKLATASDPDLAIEEAGKVFAERVEAEKPRGKLPLLTLGDRAKQDPGWLSSPPGRSDALVSWRDGTSAQLCIPGGRVGILAAPGGTGKSFALVDLALSVATGQPWLGHFPVPIKGKVLLAMAEEDQDEMKRRIYSSARRYNGSPEGEYLLSEAARNLVPLPMMGRDVGLLGADRKPSPWFDDFCDSIRGVSWRLIVLDPLSRWGGQEIETDAHAATRVVQLLEQLTQLPGNPSVIVAHHTNKAALGDGAERHQGVVRGHSALVDGARWVGLLESVRNKANAMRLRFTVVKSNYGKKPQPLELVRDAGVLRPCDGIELEHERAENEVQPFRRAR